jgi:hypothetical protein
MPPVCPLLRTLLQACLPDYLRLVEPDSAEHLCLDRASFHSHGNDERSGLGLVAEVPGLRGEKVTLLVRIEPDAPAPDALCDRLRQTFLDFEVRYGQPVLLSVICLRGARPGINLETAAIGRVFGVEVLRVFYTLFGLAGARAEYYLQRPEPLAWALAALMSPARLDPAALRQACLERIAAAPLDEPRRALLAGSVEAFLDPGRVDEPIENHVSMLRPSRIPSPAEQPRLPRFVP